MKAIRSSALLLLLLGLVCQQLKAQENNNPPPPSNNNSYSSSYSSGGEGFGKGDNVVSLGLGLGGMYGYSSVYSSGYKSGPNFILAYDNGTFDNVGPGTISLGGLLSYKGISYSYTSPYFPYYNYTEKWTYWILGFRGAYHLNVKTFRLDPYAGLMLGYYFTGYSFASNDPYFREPGDPFYTIYNQAFSSYVAMSAFIGLKYYITHKVGLWIEAGYGYTNLAYGVNIKF